MRIVRTLGLAFAVLFSPAILFAEGFYEDFHDAPVLSDGWTYGATNNVALGRYTTTASTDNKTACEGEVNALQIAIGKDPSQGVCVEILSPVSETPLRQISFCSKRTATSGESDDALQVFGRTDAEDSWREMTAPFQISTTKQWTTNEIAAAQDVRQVKFVVTASAGTFKNCSLDSLRASDEAAASDEPDDPSGPTAPTNLKLEATAGDTLCATWQGVAAIGWRATLVRMDDTRVTEVSDYSGLPSVWPEGWTHYSYDTSCYSDLLPKMGYKGSWIETGACPAAVTEVIYKFRSRKDAAFADDIRQTHIRVSVSKGEAGEWEGVERHQVSTTMQSFTKTFAPEEDVRRFRFAVEYDGDNPNYNEINIEFGKLTVSYGQVVCTEVESQTVSGPKAVFSGLDSRGRYRVRVSSLDEDDLSAESEVFDLSSVYFRATGVRGIRDLERRGVCTYSNDFSGIASVSGSTSASHFPLDWFWFQRNGSDLETILFSHKTTPTASGIYGFCDENYALASYRLGSLASGEQNYSFGLSFSNDTAFVCQAMKVSFAKFVRREGTNAADYQLEYRIGDGGWTPFENGKSIEWKTLSEKFKGGQIIHIRWMHPSVTRGPMLAIDDLKIEFILQKGFALLLR